MSSGQFLGSRERPLVSSFIDCFFFVFLCTAYIVKGTFFSLHLEFICTSGFFKNFNCIDLRASFWLDKKKKQINSKLNSNSYYYLEIIYSNHKPTVTDVLSHIKPVRSFQ